MCFYIQFLNLGLHRMYTKIYTCQYWTVIFSWWISDKEKKLLWNSLLKWQLDHVSHKIIKKHHRCTTCFLHTHLELLWCFGTNEISSESSGIGRVLTYLWDSPLIQRWFCSLRSQLWNRTPQTSNTYCCSLDQQMGVSLDHQIPSW